MIFASFLLFALTLLIIFYPVLRPAKHTEVTLQGIYKKNYLATEQRLAKALNSGTLSQEDFDAKNAEAARDLLKMTKKGHGNLSKPARLLVILIALLFPLLAIGGFWSLTYTPEARYYDAERTRLIAEFTEWREVLPASELDSLNNILTLNPQPRNPEIYNELKYGFPALFFMSAKETHDNPQTLKLLGKLLYDVKWFPAAHEVYSRILELAPNDYIANAMIIDMELERANNKITPQLAEKMERFFALYPQDTALRVMYAQTLYDNGMVNDSIAQWQLLRNLFAQNTQPDQQAQVQQTLQAIDMILASINQRTLETSQVRNFVIDSTLLSPIDWSTVSSPAIITLYMVDQETNQPIAFQETLLTANNDFPKQLNLNDFNRFKDVKEPIRNHEHLAIFGEITDSNTGEIIAATPLTELPKGAYESTLSFGPKEDLNANTDLMDKATALVKAQTAQRFLVSVDLPEMDLSELPEAATLNLFVSMQGSRMPLAAKAIRSAKHLSFPLTVEITDENLLMQGSPSLFSYKNLEVGGRLSMSTEAVGKAGDIESAKQALPTDNKTAVLLLDQVREESKATPVVPN